MDDNQRRLAGLVFILWCAQLPAGCMVAMEASSSSYMFVRGKPFDARHVSVKPGQPQVVTLQAVAGGLA